MPDMEKVIKGFKECMGEGRCTKCVYGEETQMLSCKELLWDALELLKAQELDIEALKNTIQSMVEGQCIIAGSKQPQIVRCKDCKHWKLTSCPVTEHKLGYMPPDWFCADGVAKDINVPNKEGR